MNPVIALEKVSKSFRLLTSFSSGFKHFVLHLPSYIKQMRNQRSLIALDNVSFEVHPSETFGIIGKNGSGKSTLLKLIAGVLKPSSGKITVNGIVSPLLELGAGFHPDLTGRENVILNGILLGMTKREIKERFQTIVEFSELEAFIEQPIRTYSSGMYVRLAFSVAVHTDPKILLVDEVLAVGDAGFQKKCIQKMDELRQRATTMVFVSHDLAAIKRMCDRVALLDNGQLLTIGKPDEVVNEYQRLLSVV